MVEFDIGTASDEDLCEALGKLQKGHDYIETYGFDISMDIDLEGHCKQACYIGTMSIVANEEREHDDEVETSSSGLALEVMDCVALAEGLEEANSSKRRWLLTRAQTIEARSYVGELVETLGFIAQDVERLNDEQQKERALLVFRKAITEVCSEMDRREALVAA